MAEPQYDPVEIVDTRGQEKHRILNQAMRKQLEEDEGFSELHSFKRGDIDITVIAGRHFSAEAVDLLNDKVEGLITNPETCLFLIEGMGLPKTGADERWAAEQIAEKEGVEAVFDPIINPMQASVYKAYFESKEAKKIGLGKVADFILSQEVAIHGTTAAAVKVMSEKLAFLGYGDDKSFEFALITAGTLNQLSLQESEKINQGLTAVSNDISQQVFEYYLRKNNNVKQVIAVVGQAHLPVFEKPSLIKNPFKKRLSDSEIEAALNERDRFILLDTISVLFEEFGTDVVAKIIDESLGER